MLRVLRFESLERRLLLSAVSWKGGGGNNNWDTAANWSPQGVPNSKSLDVTIASTSGATVSIETGESYSVGSLTLTGNATLSNAGSLTVAGDAGGGLSIGGDTEVTLPSVDTAMPVSNLLSNAGFESALGGGNWTINGSTFLSTQYAYAGAKSVELSGPGGVEQIFSATPGTSYTASVYAMMPAGDPLTGGEVATLQFLFFDGNNMLGSYAPPNQIVLLTNGSAPGGPLTGSAGSEGWNFFSTTAVAPANATTVEVQLASFDETSSYGGAVYFDSAAFGPSASPAALTASSISNGGELLVGQSNTVTVGGNFTQAAAATLDIQLGENPSSYVYQTDDSGAINQYGTLSIDGTAALAGTLAAQVVNGYSPIATDTFTPITFGSETGTFSSFTLPSGSGYVFDGAVSFTNVIVSAAPSAAVATSVNAATDIQAAANLLGVNTFYWDSDLSTSQTAALTSAADLDLYRFPGGAAADQFHFNESTNLGDAFGNSIAQFAEFVAAAGATGIVTVDYGSGSPQEAAAELAYLVGSPSDTTPIGTGVEWLYGAGGWTDFNWQTVGYWASLRAASPLTHDDGLNFLRIDHPAPFSSIKYWEVGNEQYAAGELDNHGTPGPGGASTGARHDPETYAAFASQFATLATEITSKAGLAMISIGIDSGDPTGVYDNNWTESVLADGKALGFVPGFISDHEYVQQTGSENDDTLLNQTATQPGNLFNWSTRYADYESILQTALGSQAAGVQVLATEYNSVPVDPGKESTSLVNGLFVATALGGLLDSGYSGASIWNLRDNDYDNADESGLQNNSNSLYGWRTSGDLGILGDTDDSNPPYTGPYIAYPSYYALQLFSKVDLAGAEVISAASSYSDMDVYAVMEPNSDNDQLELLVVNTNPAAAITDRITVSGFQPSGAAQIWQYGKAQDTAQSVSPDGASSLADSSTTLALNGATFSYTFPAYSMTVLALTQAPTVVAAAAANPAIVTAATSALSVLGGYDGGESNLAYTWTATGSPPAAVQFSVNGTNAAKNTTATFTKSGTYQLTVTITGPGAVSTTSSVSVIVDQTLASVSLSPSVASLSSTGTQQFAASGLDQFGIALLSQPVFTWSLAGAGTVSASGLYTAPYTSGSATVTATFGVLSANGSITLPGTADLAASGATTWSGATWMGSVSGTTTDNPGLRGVSGDTVSISGSAGSSVALDGVSPSLAAMALGGSVSIVTGTSGSLQLDASSGTASVAVDSGTPTIGAAAALSSNMAIITAAHATLTVSGGIAGPGDSLTVSGSGTVKLSGTDSYTGGTIVTGGTLAITGAGGLLSGSALTVGANAGVLFHSDSVVVVSLPIAAPVSLAAGRIDAMAAVSSASTGLVAARSVVSPIAAIAAGAGGPPAASVASAARQNPGPNSRHLAGAHDAVFADPNFLTPTASVATIRPTRTAISESLPLGIPIRPGGFAIYFEESDASSAASDKHDARLDLAELLMRASHLPMK